MGVEAFFGYNFILMDTEYLGCLQIYVNNLIFIILCRNEVNNNESVVKDCAYIERENNDIKVGQHEE